jgi:hypothetical protein
MPKNLKLNLYVTLPAISLILAGCSQHGDNNQVSGQLNGGGGVLAAMRPGPDQALVERLTQEEKMRAQKQAELQTQQFGQTETSVLALGRGLPKVSTDPIAPPAEQVSAAVEKGTGPNDQEAIVTSANSPIPAVTATPASYTASYYSGAGVPPPPPGAAAAGLVPPPLPVTLSTQVQTFAGSVAEAGFNPYANPYYNPYGVPVNFQQAQAQAQAAPDRPRPAGLFGEGGRSASASEGDSEAARKRAAFVPISPTGMKSRSPFQQKDDLKVLFKGALAQAATGGPLAGDAKVLTQLSHLDVAVPGEATKGIFNVSARQVDSLFRGANIDRRVVPEVHKLEADLTQNYYRYLYTYNKFCLAQQTVSARKQEVEVADSPSEQQRAAADLSQAQTDAEAARDDLHSAEYELAQASSPNSARAIIVKVSGLTPSLDSLASSESRGGKGDNRVAMLGNVLNPLGSMFKFGHAKPDAEEKKDKKQGKKDANLSANDASSDGNNAAFVPSDKAGKSEKIKKKKKEKIAAGSADGAVSDLSPAPEEGQEDRSPEPIAKQAVRESESASAHELASHSSVVAHAPTGISFWLKGVDVTARKSVLTVAIKNAGANSFDFNPDLISVAEGSHRLSEAATRADFDATSVQPNEEVKGTITIFGRPWSDKLTVCLSSGGTKTIPLRR